MPQPNHDPLGMKAAHDFVSNAFTYPRNRKNGYPDVTPFLGRYIDMTRNDSDVKKQIRELQTKLGVKADGVFSKDTYVAQTLSELDFHVKTAGPLGKNGDFGQMGQGVRALIGALDQRQDLGEALRQYQQINKLEPTGILDQNTLNSLYRVNCNVFKDPTPVLNERQVATFVGPHPLTPGPGVGYESVPAAPAAAGPAPRPAHAPTPLPPLY